MKLSTQQSYPTPIGTFELEDSDDMNNGLVELLYDIKKTEKSLGRSMSGDHGWHSPEDLLTRDNTSIKEFHKRISEVIFEYYWKKFEGAMLTSWGMIYGPGAYSRDHVHPGCDLAMTYYCKVPKGLIDDEGLLCINDPRPQARWDRCFDHTAGIIDPREGVGAIFPAWVDHYVNPHFRDGDRICISTNVKLEHGRYE